jgi:curved DNA-binding protein CbpA
MTDPYEILGIPRSATQEEIRAAWKRRAQQLHPDVCKDSDASERFNEAHTAYVMLSTVARARSEASRIGAEQLWARVSSRPPTQRQRVGLAIFDVLLRLL